MQLPRHRMNWTSCCGYTAKCRTRLCGFRKRFGIEGEAVGKHYRGCLRPEDDYEALKEFNHTYEGYTTKLEEMHLEYQGASRELKTG
jgi:hypothetical protein